MLSSQPKYEPVVWWYTRNQIGRELRERYQPPNELPPRLLALVGELREKHAKALGSEVEKLIGDIFLAIMAAVIMLIFYKHIVIF
jgi:NTP pyrophosphatase (non-canonical NTP hydrolase)